MTGRGDRVRVSCLEFQRAQHTHTILIIKTENGKQKSETCFGRVCGDGGERVRTSKTFQTLSLLATMDSMVSALERGPTCQERVHKMLKKATRDSIGCAPFCSVSSIQ